MGEKITYRYLIDISSITVAFNFILLVKTFLYIFQLWIYIKDKNTFLCFLISNKVIGFAEKLI